MKKKLNESLKVLYMGYLVLIELYDGDVDKWIHYIKEKGSSSQKKDDLSLALKIRKELEEDPFFINRIRRMIEHTRDKVLNYKNIKNGGI